MKKGTDNYINRAREIAIDGLTKNRFFPDNMKPEAIAIIDAHFKSLTQSIAAIELAVRREH